MYIYIERERDRWYGCPARTPLEPPSLPSSPIFPFHPAVSWFRAKRTESAESGAAGNFFTSFKPQKALPRGMDDRFCEGEWVNEGRKTGHETSGVSNCFSENVCETPTFWRWEEPPKGKEGTIPCFFWKLENSKGQRSCYQKGQPTYHLVFNLSWFWLFQYFEPSIFGTLFFRILDLVVLT